MEGWIQYALWPRPAPLRYLKRGEQLAPAGAGVDHTPAGCLEHSSLLSQLVLSINMPGVFACSVGIFMNFNDVMYIFLPHFVDVMHLLHPDFYYSV